MRASDFLRYTGRPIAYHPRLAKPLGSVNAAILFGQLVYWHDKTNNPLGVYKTALEIEEETGLSTKEQETARKKLKERGVLIETLKRLEHRLFFKIDFDAYDAYMDEYISENPCYITVIPHSQKGDSGNANYTLDETQKGDSYIGALDYHNITTDTLVTSSDDDASSAIKTKKIRSTKPKAPVTDIYDAYNEVLGDKLPKALILTDARKRDIAARWNELLNTEHKGKLRYSGVEDGLHWWKRLFAKVTLCPHWMGENDRGWRADLDWIINKKNFIKVLEYVPNNKK